MARTDAEVIGRLKRSTLSREREKPTGICIDQQIEIKASTEALLGLIADPQRYVAIEPRLQSARWLDDGAPREGAQVELVTDIPFTVPLVRDFIGSPSGVITLTGWRPPQWFSCRFEGATLLGELDVRIQQRSGASMVELKGLLMPRRRWMRWLLRPMRRRLEHLAAQAIQRGAERLERGLRGAPDAVDTDGPPPAIDQRHRNLRRPP